MAVLKKKVLVKKEEKKELFPPTFTTEEGKFTKSEPKTWAGLKKVTIDNDDVRIRVDVGGEIEEYFVVFTNQRIHGVELAEEIVYISICEEDFKNGHLVYADKKENKYAVYVRS